MLAQQLLHAGQALIVDNAGQALVARAIGNSFRAAFGHIDLIAGTLRQCANEAIEVGRLPHRHARSRRTLGKAGIVGLSTLLADPSRRARSIMADLALRIELARPLGEVVARRLACAPVDAGAFPGSLGRRAVGGADLHSGIVGFERAHHLRFVAASCAGELGNGGGAGFAREGVDEGDPTGGFLHAEAEHRCGITLPLIAAGAVCLLGRDIAALDPRHIVAREIAPSFHRADLDLSGGEVVPQHLLLVEGVGNQLGEGWIGRCLRDHRRSFQYRVLLVVAVPLEMPLCAGQHHVIGARIAERLPLDHPLRKGGKGTFARLSLAEISRAQRAQRILLREIMDRRRRGIVAHCANGRWIGQTTASERWR